MTTKHTPGPWKAEEVRFNPNGRNSYFAWTVQGKGKGCIAEIKYTGHHPKDEISEDEANARLIAAAPELFAVCAEIVRLGDAGIAVPEKVYIMSRAVIAKARGEQ